MRNHGQIGTYERKKLRNESRLLIYEKNGFKKTHVTVSLITNDFIDRYLMDTNIKIMWNNNKVGRYLYHLIRQNTS